MLHCIVEGNGGMVFQFSKLCFVVTYIIDNTSFHLRQREMVMAIR